MRAIFLLVLTACSRHGSDGEGEKVEDGVVNDYVEPGPSDFHPGYDPNVPDNDGDWYSENVDCDDDDPSIHPLATEVDEDIDEDCDGFFDEGEGDDPFVLCEDADGDGFGGIVCGVDVGVNNDDDCDDSNATIVPNRDEVDDNVIDDDCDGLIDERYYQASLCVVAHESVAQYEIFAASFNNPDDGTYISPESWDVRTWDELETEMTGSTSVDEAPELFIASDHEKHCVAFSALEDSGEFIVNGLGVMNDGRVRVLDAYTSDPPSLITVWLDGETTDCSFDGFYHLCRR